MMRAHEICGGRVDEVRGPPHGEPPPVREPYRAPPPYRPLSALAVTAIVVTVFGGILAFSGLWWIAGLGLILGAIGWSRLADGRKRGRGLALAAAVLSLLAGAGAFTLHRVTATELERAFDPFVRALATDDREELARWVDTPEGAEARLSTWRARMETAKSEAGAYAGRLEIGSVWLGAIVPFLVPRGVEEVEPRGESTLENPAQAFWIRAHFERGPIWLALVPSPSDSGKGAKAEALSEFLEPLARDRGAHARVHDVRVFRPAPKRSP
jgi:hypothetical protein